MFPTRILLAVDGSEESMRAARTAADLCRNLDSELHIVYAEPMPEAYVAAESEILDPDFYEKMREHAEGAAGERLGELVERVREAGGEVAGAHARIGVPDKEIVRLAEGIGAGLVVLGSRGLGALRRSLMGSVSTSVVRHAHTSVMVVRGRDGDEQDEPRGRILLALDGSREAELAATTAAELVKATGSELHVVHVDPQYVYARAVRTVETEEVAHKVLDEQVGRLRKDGVDVAEAHLRVGLPAEVIVALAEDIAAGLIVMGSRGLGGIRRALIGSITDTVVRHAHCPVMVVREEHRRGPAARGDTSAAAGTV